MEKNLLKLNLGSHNKKIDGFLNVDALTLPNVDIIVNLAEFPWTFARPRSVDEILMCEFLEHIPFRKAMNVLNECYKILKPGGKMIIQVPDIGAMCAMYVNGEICECVPRKVEKFEDFKADPGCPLCGGRAKIHPERWEFAFSGAQKHQFDAHLNHFTDERLIEYLRRAGFRKIEKIKNIYKLIFNVWK